MYKTDSHMRMFATSLLALGLLTACGDTTEAPSSGNAAPIGANSSYEVTGDHAVGNPDAAVTVVEYASVVCGACASWHNTVYPEFKKKYVESGKVRYIFREFPTPPERLAFAGFTIANCAGEGKFLKNIQVQYKRQRALLSAPDKRAAYENLAKASGLSIEQYETCLSDPEWKAKYDAVVQGGSDIGVTSTPSFFINGTKAKVFTLEQFDEMLAPMLGEAAPEETISEEDTKEAAE